MTSDTPTVDTATDTDNAADADNAHDGSMRAAVRHRYGSADVVAVERRDVPAPGANQVLIEVVAAGLDRGVWHVMTGRPYLARLVGFGVLAPKQPVLGMDVAGRVVAVGSSVDEFAVGDEVMGIGTGSFAEYAVADAAKLVRKPVNVTFEQAAVSTISGITALQALTDVGGVTSGQRVLVVGASGGVGSFAVQIAKALGASVTGVARTSKLDLVMSLGADAVVDYTTTDIADLDQCFDLIIDTGGRTPLRRLRRILTERGTYVIVGAETGGRLLGGVGRNLRAAVLSLFVRQRLTSFISKEGRASIESLVELLGAGDVVPAIGQRASLTEVPDALRALESGRASGKTVVAIRPE
jgi:NADPH:quinone reductase-like Zn-dependent oxidoreductase